MQQRVKATHYSHLVQAVFAFAPAAPARPLTISPKILPSYTRRTSSFFMTPSGDRKRIYVASPTSHQGIELARMSSKQRGVGSSDGGRSRPRSHSKNVPNAPQGSARTRWPFRLSHTSAKVSPSLPLLYLLLLAPPRLPRPLYDLCSHDIRHLCTHVRFYDPLQRGFARAGCRVEGWVGRERRQGAEPAC